MEIKVFTAFSGYDSQCLALDRMQEAFPWFSYELVELPPDSVIYCDIPYKDTAEYLNGFDHETFYNWVRNQTVPIFISEYQMPPDFMVVKEMTKRVTLSATNNSKKSY